LLKYKSLEPKEPQIKIALVLKKVSNRIKIHICVYYFLRKVFKWIIMKISTRLKLFAFIAQYLLLKAKTLGPKTPQYEIALELTFMNFIKK